MQSFRKSIGCALPPALRPLSLPPSLTQMSLSFSLPYTVYTVIYFFLLLVFLSLLPHQLPSPPEMNSHILHESVKGIKIIT